MNICELRSSLHSVDDPFDIYEAFVRNTHGSPEEQVQVWKQHIGIDTALDYYLQLTLCVREYCNNKYRNKQLDHDIDSLWNSIIDASHPTTHGVVESPTNIIDLT